MSVVVSHHVIPHLVFKDYFIFLSGIQPKFCFIGGTQVKPQSHFYAVYVKVTGSFVGLIYKQTYFLGGTQVEHQSHVYAVCVNETS